MLNTKNFILHPSAFILSYTALQKIELWVTMLCVLGLMSQCGFFDGMALRK